MRRIHQVFIQMMTMELIHMELVKKKKKLNFGGKWLLLKSHLRFWLLLVH